MISDIYAPYSFILGTIVFGILFLVSTFIQNMFIQSLSFAFIFSMLFVVFASPKSMWRYNALHKFTNVGVNQ